MPDLVAQPPPAEPDVQLAIGWADHDAASPFPVGFDEVGMVPGADDEPGGFRLRCPGLGDSGISFRENVEEILGCRDAVAAFRGAFRERTRSPRNS